MATIKLFSDLQQSKKLAEFLPLESADGFYAANVIITEPYITYLNGERNIPGYKGAIPCWSLASLISVLPKYEIHGNGKTITLDVNLEALEIEGDETLLDLVVNMIIHLHELNLL